MTDEIVTATHTPETEAENLNTGLLDQWGKPILRQRARIKMGFDLSPAPQPDHFEKACVGEETEVSEWRSTNQTPDWQEFHAAELKATDGSTVKGSLFIIDVDNNGADEWPIVGFRSENGEELCFWDFVEWRLR